jgi:hypothetical protein
MIKDHELLRNINLLYTKKFVIWGLGERGKELAERMYEQTKDISFVDSDKTKVGAWGKISVYNPKKIAEYSKAETVIVIPTDNEKVQESIMRQIISMGYQDIDIYTRYAMDAALSFVKKSGNIKSEGEIKQELLSMKIEAQQGRISCLSNHYKMMNQILLAAIADNSVYVYQSKKVASTSIYVSARAAGVFGVHVHNFAGLDLPDCLVKNMIKKTSGKVISIVREPVARQISLLWSYWKNGESFLRNYDSLEELESKFYSIPNEEDEFEWYLKEFKDILGVNIYDHQFDRDLGYSIIEKDGISILLLKLEKLFSLEKVIGNFLGVENYKLVNTNTGKEKSYRYAYENYLEHVKIPRVFWEHYYSKNEYMNYFYTDDEKKMFYERWKEYLL